MPARPRPPHSCPLSPAGESARRTSPAGLVAPRPSRLARRIKTLTTDLATNRAGISGLITDTAPELLALTGVGPAVAASVIIAWSHPGRVRFEAAMGSLAGTCPVPASSGNTVRYRLNRGGDRRLNRSLTTGVFVRMRIEPATRAYAARRRAEGRTTKESRE